MLFLSHASEDREAARELALRLGATGLEVWCSSLEGSLRDGLPFREQIYAALDRCTAFASLNSPASAQPRSAP